MIDIKFLRENPDVVKENIKKKFQDSKLPLVDEVIALDEELRQNKRRADDLRANRNKVSKSIGALMGQKRFEEAEEAKKLVAAQAAELAECEKKEAELEERVKNIMMIIPNIIDPSVPVGKDDSENVEVERYGEPLVPDFEIPYHTEIMEKFAGIAVVPGDFGWDDVGSFAAFDTYFPHDRAGNVREGPCTVVDAADNICVARAARISLLGVRNLVVITTPDAVLVADKSKIGEMKKLFRKD